ncbi:MAG: hypothetical protein K1X89_02285 [Myxococcaceae bacterium]|nr:hypothetical protein [Myxococcaceae bacterium]
MSKHLPALFWAVLLTALLGGCDKAEQPKFKAHQFKEALSASQDLGEACDSFGAGSCLTGTCIHTGARPAVGHFCSIQCEVQDDCPDRWNCIPIMPSAPTKLCVPPTNWVAAKASVATKLAPTKLPGSDPAPTQIGPPDIYKYTDGGL